MSSLINLQQAFFTADILTCHSRKKAPMAKFLSSAPASHDCVTENQRTQMEKSPVPVQILEYFLTASLFYMTVNLISVIFGLLIRHLTLMT